jgi:hypothetical protein
MSRKKCGTRNRKQFDGKIKQTDVHLTSTVYTELRIWDSHSGGYEEFCLWDIRPCSPLKVNWYFGGMCRLHRQGRRTNKKPSSAAWFTLVSCSAYFSSLKMATCSSETSVNFQRAARHYSPEHRILHRLTSGLGAWGSVVRWGIMLQAGRSLDRVPMRCFFFQFA